MNQKETLITIIAITCLALVWFAYQNLVVIPQGRLEYEKQRNEEAKAQEMQRALRYRSCVQTAINDYTMNWNLNCKNRGLQENCDLPILLSSKLNDDLNEAKTKTCPAEANNSY